MQWKALFLQENFQYFEENTDHPNTITNSCCFFIYILLSDRNDIQIGRWDFILTVQK